MEYAKCINEIMETVNQRTEAFIQQLKETSGVVIVNTQLGIGAISSIREKIENVSFFNKSTSINSSIEYISNNFINETTEMLVIEEACGYNHKELLSLIELSKKVNTLVFINYSKEKILDFSDITNVDFKI